MYEFEISKDGKKILKKNHNGKYRYLGSFYNHNNDIEEFISNVGEINDSTIIITYGLADAEHLLKLVDIKHPESKVIIFEKDENLINDIKNNDYYVNLNNDKNTYIIEYDQKNINLNLWKLVSLNNLFNIKIVSYKILEKYNYKELITITNEIESFRKQKIIDNNTINKFSEKWFKLFISNFKYTLGSTIINDLKDIMKDKPAIIVSAGPSLEKNISLLKECKDNFIIISGGRTLKSLSNIGVKPDFIGVIDSGEVSYDLTKDYINTDTPLLFTNTTHEKILANHKGKKIYNGATMDFIGYATGKQVEGMSTGGSIAHTCTEFAAYLGCNPIIFIGQDLAYTNDKLHANIAENNDKYKKLEKINIKNSIFVDDIYGNKVRTNNLFYSFKVSLENIINKYPNITFINATEGGANIKNTTVLTLKETISEYSDLVDTSFLDLKESLSEDEKKKVIYEFENSIKLLREIKEKSKICLRLNEKLNKAYNKKDLKQYYIIDNKIRQCEKDIKLASLKVPFIASLLNPIISKVMLDRKWIINDSENDKEKFKKIYEKTKYMYSEICLKIDFALKYIEESYEV